MKSKKDIRIYIKERKENLSISDTERYSNTIINKLISTEEYINSKTIFTYVSFNQEVITNKLIQQSLKTKKVAVPKIVNDQMIFYYIESIDELKTGIKGILEPVNISGPYMATPEDGSLFIVPGLAFDNNKNRIGYGRGYYDQYFNKYMGLKLNKVGLAFEFQVIDQVPVEDNDVKLDTILTETRIIN